MQQVARITDALPVLDIVEKNDPPFVLLPHQLEAFISDHVDFAPGCQDGFEGFCDYGDGFLDFATPEGMQSFVASEVCRSYRPGEIIFGVFSLPYRVGFCLGFLSTLAHTHRDLAHLGIDCLPAFISYAYQDEVGRGFNPLVAVPGIHKSRLKG